MSIRKIASILLFFLFTGQTLHAEIKTYVREYRYHATPYDTHETSRAMALDQVRSNLLNEIGTHIQSVMHVRKDASGEMEVTEDTVALSAGIVQMNILDENWNPPEYYIKARMQADPEDVLRQIEDLRMNEELAAELGDSQRKLQRAEQEIRQLRQQLGAGHAPASAQRYRASVNTLRQEMLFQEGLQARWRENFAGALNIFRQLADQGHGDAMARVGLMHLKGYGVEESAEQARDWYVKAVEHGSGEGLARLGVLYQTGRGVKKDLNRAFLLMKQAADQGHPRGKARLGFMYLNGIGTGKDEGRALDLFRESAAEGDAMGMVRLGFMYEQGLGVERDQARAVELYKKSARKGNGHAYARLGIAYLKGNGVNRDGQRAVKLFARSCKMKNPMGCARLARLYEKGIVVDKDIERAAGLYLRAAGEGSRFAMFYLANLYKKGDGVEKDKKKYRYWMQRSAELGFPKAVAHVANRF